MKMGNYIVGLLFKSGEKCADESIATHAILTSGANDFQKIRSIFGDTGGVIDDEGHYLSPPNLATASFASVRAVISATLLVCSKEGHHVVGYIGHQVEVYPPFNFRDGAIFGLLDALALNPRTDKTDRVTFCPDVGKCSLHTAALLCVLELIWQAREDKALSPEKAGELSNLVSEYVRDCLKGKIEETTRLISISHFLKQAGKKYKNSKGFPSQMAEAVTNNFLYKTFNQLPIEKRLELVDEAICCVSKV